MKRLRLSRVVVVTLVHSSSCCSPAELPAADVAAGASSSATHRLSHAIAGALREHLTVSTVHGQQELRFCCGVHCLVHFHLEEQNEQFQVPAEATELLCSPKLLYTCGRSGNETARAGEQPGSPPGVMLARLRVVLVQEPFSFVRRSTQTISFLVIMIDTHTQS